MKYLFGSIFAFYSSNLFASANDWQLSFQNPATDLMQEVIELHDLILIMMTVITLFVLFLLFLTFISRGEIETILDLLKFLTKFFDENLFIKKP